MRGIDVSYAQGSFNWERAKSAGISFAFIKASQGRSEYSDDSGAFRDPQFARNITECMRLGIECGVYHYLTARTVEEARAETKFFCSVLAPYTAAATMWAAVDVESRWLPFDRETLTAIVKAFTDVVSHNGFSPMLYTNPDFLRNRLTRDESVPLWLALWTSNEDAARAYAPAVWQYGIDTELNVDGDIIFEDPETDGSGEEKASAPPARPRVYPSWEEFDERETGIPEDAGEVFFRKAGVFQLSFPSWAYFKASEEETLREAVGPAVITVLPISYNEGRTGLIIDADPQEAAGPPDEAEVIPGRRARAVFDKGGAGLSKLLTPYLSSLTYIDADADEADDLQFTLSPGDPEISAEIIAALEESRTVPLGVNIIKETGAPDGSVSRETLICGSFYVDEISETLLPTRINVKAASVPLSDAAKKKTSWTWGDAEKKIVSLLEIASGVASELSLLLVNESAAAASFVTAAPITQYRQTGLEFLSTLCAQANVTVKVSNGCLILTDTDSVVASVLVIRAGDCTGVTFTTGSALLEYSRVVVTYTAPDGTFYYGVAWNEDVKGGKSSVVSMKVSSDAEAREIAASILKSYERYIVSVSLTMPGTTKLASGMDVLLDGFGQSRDGTYTITQIRHMLGNSGFISAVELRKKPE